jgi:thymidylate kinase
MKHNIILSFEGPDRAGKSEIAAELSRQLGVPVFKNTGEWSTDLKDPSYFKNLLIYGGTFLIDFIHQTRPSAILDRHYPSEWVYSRFFNRETNEEVVRKIDQKFAEAGGKIIICRRKSYNGIQDDLHAYVDSKVLEGLDTLYDEFTKWTSCEVLTVWVDDENLEREISEIREWLKK